jgi:hypothetical protein
MLFMIEFIREILIGGVETVVAFTSWDWLDKNNNVVGSVKPSKIIQTVFGQGKEKK